MLVEDPEVRFNICLVVMGLLFHVIFAVYSFYSIYIRIFFNSRTAVRIARNVSAKRAFIWFYWILALPIIPFDMMMGLTIIMGLVWLITVVGQILPTFRLHWFLHILLAVPFALLCGLCLVGGMSMFVWLPSTIQQIYQDRVFNHGCAAAGWDLDIALASVNASNLIEMPFVAGIAHISWTRHPNNPSTTAQLVRHTKTLFHFDFAPPGAIHSPIVNVTYEWGDGTYVAFRPDSTIISGTFTRTPSLTFPSLDVSVVDPFIPFERPRYSACWPAAATLIVHGPSHKLLETITFKYQDQTQMKVCGRGAESDVALVPELQISLGVVFIGHYFFSLCLK